MRIQTKGKAEIVFTSENGEVTKEVIHDFDGAGILMGMHNLDKSIESFARSCVSYALALKQDLWFSTKDTISKNTIILLKIYLSKFMKRV